MKIILLSLLMISTNLIAQNTWADLSHKQQNLLLPFESDWNKLDTQTRKKLLTNTDKWLNMSQTEKVESRQKLNRFKQLSEQQQQQLKDKLKRYKQLSQQEKRVLKQAHNHYKTLTPKQKKRLKQKYDQLGPKQRKNAFTKYKRKQQGRKFISEFDIELRKPLVQMFAQIPKANRVKLKKHLVALSAKERHNITLDLLEMSPVDRINFIESIKI